MVSEYRRLSDFVICQYVRPITLWILALIWWTLQVWILKSLREFLQIGAVKHPFFRLLHGWTSQDIPFRPSRIGTVSDQILLVNPMGNPISFQDFLGTTPLIRVLALGHWKDLRKKPGKCWSDQANHVEPIWPYVFLPIWAPKFAKPENGHSPCSFGC